MRYVQRSLITKFLIESDKALERLDLLPRTRKKCLKSLCKICDHHALLPRALKIPVCHDRTAVALYKGGFADVWKGEHRGQDVAVKVIRTYSNSDLQKIIRVCCRSHSRSMLQYADQVPFRGSAGRL